MILLPKPIHQDHGLFRLRGPNWYVRWMVDGKPKLKSSQTSDIDEARAIRDRIYEGLRAKGAVVTGSPEHVSGTDRYINRRPQYVVNVPGHPQREAVTLDEARAIRNELVGGGA